MASTWIEILAKIILHLHLVSWRVVVSHTVLWVNTITSVLKVSTYIITKNHRFSIGLVAIMSVSTFITAFILNVLWIFLLKMIFLFISAIYCVYVFQKVLDTKTGKRFEKSERGSKRPLDDQNTAEDLSPSKSQKEHWFVCN